MKNAKFEETSVHDWWKLAIAIHVKTTLAYIRHNSLQWNIRPSINNTITFIFCYIMEQVRQAIREDRLGDFREESSLSVGYNKPNAASKHNRLTERVKMMTGTLGTLVPIILMFAVTLLLLIRPQQSSSKRLYAKCKEELKKGDSVVTIRGLFWYQWLYRRKQSRD